MDTLGNFDSFSWDISTNTCYGETIVENGKLEDIELKRYNKFEDSDEPIVVNINFMAAKEDKSYQVAKVELFLINAFIGCANIFSTMDGYSADSGDALMYHLLKSDEFGALSDEYTEFQTLLIGILQEIYVFPDFRRCGIFTWINNNLIKLIRIGLNCNIGCLATQLRPYKDNKYGEYVNKDNEMTNIMCNVFLKNGWRKIDKNIYIKSFLDELQA